MSQTKATYTALMYMYMYFGGRAPSPERIHQFRGLTLVLQNFSCLDMDTSKENIT